MSFNHIGNGRGGGNDARVDYLTQASVKQQGQINTVEAEVKSLRTDLDSLIAAPAPMPIVYTATTPPAPLAPLVQNHTYVESLSAENVAQLDAATAAAAVAQDTADRAWCAAKAAEAEADLLTRQVSDLLSENAQMLTYIVNHGQRIKKLYVFAGIGTLINLAVWACGYYLS